MLKGAGLALLTAGLLLLSGCVQQELGIEERLLCVDLSSESYAAVPECSTQAECFSHVESELFNFDLHGFSANLQAELHAYKNEIALSWLYFNKARKNIEEINKICSTNANTAALPENVNELNFNLVKAFEASDAAHERSFAILLLEENSLASESIDLMREEPLYNDYIAINNNLNDLGASTAAGSSTYVAFYREQSQAIDSLVNSTGFSRVTVKEKTALDLLAQYDAAILSGIMPRQRIFYIPIISDALQTYISSLNQAAKIKQAISVMQQSPTFEFLQAYNNLLGTESSTAGLFAELLRNDALHRTELAQRLQEIENSIRESLQVSQAAIESMLSSSYANLDQNFISELYSLLGQSSHIATQRYEIQDMQQLSSSAKNKIAEMQLEFAQIMQKDFLGELPLGEKASKLKALYNKLALLKENLEYLSTEVTSGLAVLCDERTAQINGAVSAAEIPEEFFLKLSDLKARVKFKTSQYNAAGSAESKLQYCRAALQEYNAFKLALQDFEAFSQQESIALEKCFAFLDSVFSAESALDLGDFSARYQTLSRIPKPYADVSMARRSCVSLQNDLQLFLQQNPQIKSIEEIFSETKELLLQLQAIAQHYPDFSNQTEIARLEQQFSEIVQYFKDSKLQFSMALPNIGKLQGGLAGLNAGLHAQLQKTVAAFAQENASIAAFPDAAAVLGKEFSTKFRIALENPFQYSIPRPLVIKIPFKENFSELLFKTENVSALQHEAGHLLIDLNSLPKGLTIVEFSANSIVTADEGIELLSINSGRAQFMKQLTLRSNAAVPLLHARILLIDAALETGDVFILSGSAALNYAKENNMVEFSISNASNGKKIEIYFSVLRPLEYSIMLEKITQTDANNFQHEFEVKLRNLLPMQVNSISLMLPFETAENKISALEFFDAAGRNIKFDLLADKNIRFSVPALLPMQTWQGRIVAKIKDPGNFWREFLLGQKASAEALAQSMHPAVSSKAGQLLQELGKISGADLSRIENINALVAAANKIALLENEQSSMEQAISAFASLKNEVGQSISSLDSVAQQLLQLNFHDANELQGKISDARQHLKQADELFSSNQVDAAMNALFKAKSLLPKQLPESAMERIDAELQGILSGISMQWQRAGKYAVADSALKTKYDDLLKLHAAVQTSLAQQDLQNAKKTLDLLAGNAASFEADINSMVRARALAIKRNVESFNAALDSIKEKISFLQDLFKNAAENDLIAAHYVLPITESRLRSIESKSKNLGNAAMQNSINKFLDFISAENFPAALDNANFSEQLNSELGQATAINAEIDSATEAIKEDAFAFYNSAVALFNKTATPSAGAKAELEFAKNAVENNELLSAIIHSNNATALLSVAKGIDAPLYSMPIVAAIVLIAALRYAKKKRSKMRKERIQKVLRNWH